MNPRLAEALHARRVSWTDDHRPRVYRLDDAGDTAGLTDLLHERPGLRVVDEIATQLRELAEVRHPDRRRDRGYLDAVVRDLLAGRAPEDHGAYVLFPWRNCLVHLLDGPEFVEVRTSRNRNKITPAEQERLSRLRVGVVGLSVGQSVALTIATERSCGHLRLADFDRLDLSNLNRLHAGVADLRLPKTVVAARAIAELDPYLDVACWSAGVDETNVDSFLTDGGRLDVVVEECDSLDVKFLVRERARAFGIPVLMVTSEGGLVDVERFDQEAGRPVLHGLVGDVSHHDLRELSPPARTSLVLEILGPDAVSPRMLASLDEIGRSLVTWPQLASAVVLGGAVAGDTWRRIALGEDVPSGRFRVDPGLAIPGADDGAYGAADRPRAGRSGQADPAEDRVPSPRGRGATAGRPEPVQEPLLG